MASFGGKHNRRKNPRPSPQSRTYCKGIKWLDKYQRNLCYRFPGIIPLIKDGIKHALKECRRQFSSFRWNCSSLNWKEVLNDGGILKKRKSHLFLYTIDSYFMSSNDVVSDSCYCQLKGILSMKTSLACLIDTRPTKIFKYKNIRFSKNLLK